MSTTNHSEAVNKLIALAFVPIADVVQRILLFLVDQEADELLDYFEKYWVGDIMTPLQVSDFRHSANGACLSYRYVECL